uniref:Uncharacterized protein n=1 Tax=Vespula pensylvanica TaxID=30213 RepID=A0A834JUF4_VESPE|nr:hypothetical protein H0235_016955 [Vespula pensylvanica]
MYMTYKNQTQRTMIYNQCDETAWRRTLSPPLTPNSRPNWWDFRAGELQLFERLILVRVVAKRGGGGGGGGGDDGGSSSSSSSSNSSTSGGGSGGGGSVSLLTDINGSLTSLPHSFIEFRLCRILPT